MSSIICRTVNTGMKSVLLGILLLTPMIAAAKCGGVDYSWGADARGADALATAHDYTVTMMLYVLYLVYAIASIVAIIGALQIYFKMTTGEGDVTKSIMMLIGAIIFIIGASIVFPAFFGYHIA